MFSAKTLTILIVLFLFPNFFLGCSKVKQIITQEKVADDQEFRQTQNTSEKIREQSEEQPNLITLKANEIKQAGIKTSLVSAKQLKMEYSFPGKVSINETKLTHISPRISGRVVSVYAKLGDIVKTGQMLAVIDSPELAETESQYLKAKIELSVAEKSYQRAKFLLDNKIISISEFQQREGNYLISKSETEALEDKLHLLGMTDAQLLTLEKNHKINSRVAIPAPLSGTVIEREVTAGEVVEIGSSLFVIADLSNLWIIADVPEIDISKIKKGQPVKVTVASYPDKTFVGNINYISPTMNAETRTVKARVAIGNEYNMLKPEMFATVKIAGLEKSDVLTIPESAVQRENNKVIVFVAKTKNSFEKRIVALGAKADGFYEVLSGVKEGESVVTKGVFTLKSILLKELMEED